MYRSNSVKILTKDEVKKINDTYLFNVDDKDVIVESKLLGRKTKHSKKKKFTLDCNYLGLRKITITVEAIDIYSKINKNKYSLIDVQRALNYLYKNKIECSLKNVEKELKNL